MEQAGAHADRVAATLASNAAVYSPLAASWNRSARLHGLDAASRRDAERVAAAEIRRAREKMALTLKAAQSSLDRLFSAVGSVGCCVLLANAEGISVERRGAVADDHTFEDWGLWTGTCWSEAYEGTNAIGTCLAEERAVTVHRGEHFLARNTDLSCMSAPVYDEHGRMAGVLDVSSCRADLTEAFIGLISHSVAEAARRIEAETFRLAFPMSRIVMVPGIERGATALVAVDADDMVVGATRNARRALGLDEDLESRPSPAADLLGVEGAESLDRAERAVLMRALAREDGNRSEERRVGKECRSRWSPYH